LKVIKNNMKWFIIKLIVRIIIFITLFIIGVGLASDLRSGTYDNVIEYSIKLLAVIFIIGVLIYLQKFRNFK